MELKSKAIIVKEIDRILIELKGDPLDPLIISRGKALPFKVVIFFPEQDESVQDILSALPGESILKK